MNKWFLIGFAEALAHIVRWRPPPRFMVDTMPPPVEMEHHSDRHLLETGYVTHCETYYDWMVEMNLR